MITGINFICCFRWSKNGVVLVQLIVSQLIFKCSYKINMNVLLIWWTLLVVTKSLILKKQSLASAG